MERAARGQIEVVGQDAAGERLDKWLAAPSRLGSRRQASEALLRGRVWVDGVEQTVDAGARRLRAGQEVRLWVDRPGSAGRLGPHRAGALDILFEDADLIVVAKPAGLLTVPLAEQPTSPSLADAVEAHWRSHGHREPLAVHRLDRDTSGPVVFARSPQARHALREQFASRTPERIYRAVVYGVPQPAEGTWRTWLSWDPHARVQRPVPAHRARSFEAIGHFAVVERFTETALVEVRLVTGRRHQVRVQAWLAGHPLVGERIYTGPPAPVPPCPVEFGRQALHGRRLGFVHPRTSERLAFDVPPPPDFRALLRQLR